MSDDEFERHVLAILSRELGADGLARFLRLYRSGSGDYTRDRHRWLEGAAVQEIMREVQRRDAPAAESVPAKAYDSAVPPSLLNSGFQAEKESHPAP